MTATFRALLLLVLAACGGLRVRGPAASCTHVQSVREVRGTAVCEDVWTCGRPPGGAFDRVGLRRVALCEGAVGPVVLYLPGMHMNARLPVGDPRHDLRLYLAVAGARTWGLDYRTHAVPADAQPAGLEALAGWTAAVFTEDASWAAAFARSRDAGPLYIAGFSFGAGLAYRLAARRDVGVDGLVILDGTQTLGRGGSGGGVAIDVGGSRLPWAERQRLLGIVMADPSGASPLPGYPDAGTALAEVLYTAPAFGGAGGLSAALDGVSDVQTVARLLASYDRWWPRATLDGSTSDAPRAPLPVLAFATTNMGPEWVARVRRSAEAVGGPRATVRELKGWGHLDVLVGLGAASQVFEPTRAWVAGPPS